ncbi:adenylyltransferase/cytidyltransferase family protein [Pseudoflavonifractor sp. 524-17]|uniref:adenylyltransferase/cytidyltransferase family protein n=1 Tax=Pseudoflavonifractor sp. 524-17 TaxID=2304577 RepID=UPI00192A4EB1
MKEQLGVITGRFQGLHLGHMEYLLAAAERCEHLIVGLTNFSPWEEAPAALQGLKRLEADANPFTFYERMVMLRDSLMEAGLPRERFDIVPFPIEHPERISHFAPPEAIYFMTIYDQWGEHKKKVLEDLGLRTEVMWVRTDSQRLTSGTEIRRLIAQGEPWTHLVPPAVRRYLDGHDLVRRLQGGTDRVCPDAAPIFSP